MAAERLPSRRSVGRSSVWLPGRTPGTQRGHSPALDVWRNEDGSMSKKKRQRWLTHLEPCPSCGNRLKAVYAVVEAAELKMRRRRLDA